MKNYKRKLLIWNLGQNMKSNFLIISYRKILSNPNSSVVWIEFVAYAAENEGIESARNVMERALRVINFNNEQERLNLWTAYLNLEFNFGTEDNLISAFKRGC